MLSQKLVLLFKRLNPGARCWYDNNKLVQSGVCQHVVSYTR